MLPADEIHLRPSFSSDDSALADTLDALLERARQIVPHDASCVILIGREGPNIGRSFGWSTDHLEQLCYDWPLGTDVDLLNDRAVVIEDTSVFALWQAFPALAWIKSHLALPIQCGGRVLAILCLESVTPGGLTRQHATALQPLASWAAAALTQAPSSPVEPGEGS
jgi:GAF domain-containing protein